MGVGVGMGMEVWRMKGWMTGSLNGGDGEKSMMLEGGFIFLLFDTCDGTRRKCM